MLLFRRFYDYLSISIIYNRLNLDLLSTHVVVIVAVAAVVVVVVICCVVRKGSAKTEETDVCRNDLHHTKQKGEVFDCTELMCTSSEADD